MNSIITVFGDSLSIGGSSFDDLLLKLIVIFPFAAFFASLFCMRRRKWKAVIVIAILLALYSVVNMLIFGIVEMALPLLYSMFVCIIVYDRKTKEKQIQKSGSQGADTQQTSDDESERGEGE